MTKPSKKTRRSGKGPVCALCKASLVPSAYPDLMLHPDHAECTVIITDGLGVCVDDAYEVVDGEIYAREAPVVAPNVPVAFGGAIFIDGVAMSASPEGSGYTAVDGAIKQLFETVGKPHLGGS